jgi:hypothetical protein
MSEPRSIPTVVFDNIMERSVEGLEPHMDGSGGASFSLVASKMSDQPSDLNGAGSI